MRLGGLVNHRLDQRLIDLSLLTDGIELVGILLRHLLHQFRLRLLNGFPVTGATARTVTATS